MTTDRWTYFREELLKWYEPDRRPMPWKAHAEAYNIWLSEIILQQTRVEQGRGYYERFAEAYPTVVHLAAAAEDDVLKLWEGLGYYSRARNLLKAAQMVVREYNGSFPRTYSELRKLPGVGPYTAAAIASFAFGEQVAVLDGNVFRILARYQNSATPIDTTTGKKEFTRLAETALGDAPANVYNQAIMDFGALVCTPRRAACPSCPLRETCIALAEGRVYELPVKQKKLKRRTRYFHYLVLRDEAGRTAIQQRGDGDIWQGLYEFPLIEAAAADTTSDQLPLLPSWPDWLPSEELQFTGRSETFKQQLTHQTIYAVFHQFSWPLLPGSQTGIHITTNKLLKNYAFPRVITKFIENNHLLLSLF